MEIQHSGGGGFKMSTYAISWVSKRPGYDKHFPYFLRTLGMEEKKFYIGVEGKCKPNIPSFKKAKVWKSLSLLYQSLGEEEIVLVCFGMKV